MYLLHKEMKPRKTERNIFPGVGCHIPSALDRTCQAADDLLLEDGETDQAGIIAREVKANTCAVSTECSELNICTPSGNVYLLSSLSTNSGSM